MNTSEGLIYIAWNIQIKTGTEASLAIYTFVDCDLQNLLFMSEHTVDRERRRQQYMVWRVNTHGLQSIDCNRRGS